MRGIQTVNPVTWHGQRRDWDDLLAAFKRNCDRCRADGPLCADHRGVLGDQQALDHLLFARAKRSLWRCREWTR